jgi:hypothetical protein
MIALLTGLLPRALGGLGAALATSLLVPAVRRRVAEGADAAATKVRVLRGRSVPDDRLECGPMHECTADALDPL